MTIRQQMRKRTTTLIILSLLTELERPMYGCECRREVSMVIDVGASKAELLND